MVPLRGVRLWGGTAQGGQRGPHAEAAAVAVAVAD